MTCETCARPATSCRIRNGSTRHFCSHCGLLVATQDDLGVDRWNFDPDLWVRLPAGDP